MLVTDFDFTLPQELIAQYPLKQRSGSRLLTLEGNTGKIEHKQFVDLIDLLLPNDLLIFNDTRVLAARLEGHKQTGGKVEILIERILSEKKALAHIKASKAPKAGTELFLSEDIRLRVEGREEDLFVISLLSEIDFHALMNKLGKLPIPPYLDRQAETLDDERYQTLYAKHPGAIAAPTAGLHFDETLLNKLKQRNIQMAFVTLHVGAGTFQPVRVSTISEHHMHSEWLSVNQATCDSIKQTKASGGRVIAIGTTSVRSLETASQSGEINPFEGESRIFIYPGYQFKTVDAMVTNFHLPQSTLLMLTCAFAGFNETMLAYSVAIEQRYRFFSYGDAMFVTNKKIV